MSSSYPGENPYSVDRPSPLPGAYPGQNPYAIDRPREPEVLEAELVDEPPAVPGIFRRWVLPLGLYLATWFTTWFVSGGNWQYSLGIMSILTFHELGHFLQAKRYGVPCSWPMFIPMPLPPLGTMGAVIFMQPGKGDRKQLFDIGISGPLAGLVPTFICLYLGFKTSAHGPLPDYPYDFLGNSLFFRALTDWYFGPIPPGQDLMLSSLAYAGWAGLLLTALNLFPIGQLDGGHILYALLKRKAWPVATLVLFGAAAAVAVFGLWHWIIMLLLLWKFGARHPPTENDDVPLGAFRTALGWATLIFGVLAFPPTPFSLVSPK